jgi:hypothetical protein
MKKKVSASFRLSIEDKKGLQELAFLHGYLGRNGGNISALLRAIARNEITLRKKIKKSIDKKT